jgi:hypothetical protein
VSVNESDPVTAAALRVLVDTIAPLVRGEIGRALKPRGRWRRPA